MNTTVLVPLFSHRGALSVTLTLAVFMPLAANFYGLGATMTGSVGANAIAFGMSSDGTRHPWASNPSAGTSTTRSEGRSFLAPRTPAVCCTPSGTHPMGFVGRTPFGPTSQHASLPLSRQSSMGSIFGSSSTIGGVSGGGGGGGHIGGDSLFAQARFRTASMQYGSFVPSFTRSESQSGGLQTPLHLASPMGPSAAPSFSFAKPA